jgi:putative hydrolase of the HAD superfamily
MIPHGSQRLNPTSVGCQALLIDFDGVLRVWPVRDTPIDRVLHQVAFEPGLLMQAVTGKMPDEHWRGEIARRLSEHFPEAEAVAAVDRWSQPAGSIDSEVLGLLTAARERVRLVLVTNATSRLDADLDALGLHDFFHAVANSSVIGAAKPHREFFAAALSLAGVSPGESLFIDDSSANVTGAEALGIRSQLFKGHHSLREFLHSNGVLP